MKKSLPLILAVLLLIALAACAGAPEETKTAGPEGTRIEDLSAGELCALAAGMKTKLSAYRFETVCTVQPPAGAVEDRTLRETYLRAGYQSYDSSVTMSAGGRILTALIYENSTAVAQGEDGTVYLAEKASKEDFEAASAQLCPYRAFQDRADFDGLTKEGATLRFEGAADPVSFHYPAGFLAKKVSGVQNFDADGFYLEETITYTGDLGTWKDIQVTFTSRAIRGEDLALETVDTENAVKVNDLRAPGLAQTALNALTEEKELALTLSESHVAGDAEHHTDSALSVIGTDGGPGGPDFLLEERQARKTDGEWAYATRFVECRGALRRDAVYEQTVLSDGSEEPEGQKKGDGKEDEPEDPIRESEVTAAEKEAALRELLWDKLPALSDLSSLTLTEHPDRMDVAFTLKEDLAAALFLPEQKTGAFKTVGEMQIGPEGELLFLSFSAEAADGSFVRFALTVDARENVVLGTITPPEPVDPNTNDGDHHDG